MIARIAVAWLAFAPLSLAQVVVKLNGPLAGNVRAFAWAPDGRYVLYGAARNAPGIDVVTSVRLSNGSEVVYDPYASFIGSASANELVFLPDAELVGVRYFTYDGSSFPPVTGSPLHVLERATALPVTVSAAQSPHFLADGRMVYRTSFTAFRGSTYERAWSGRWDVDATTLELSPPVQPDNHVSLVLPAPRAGVAGGTSVRLSGPMTAGGDVGLDDFWISPDGARVVYRADQRADGVFELHSAPLDGHAPAVRLHPALPASADAVEAVHFTPDGRFVVFAVHLATGGVLLAAPSDASRPPVSLNWPFPAGGGVLEDASGIRSSVAIASGGRHVFFLGEQDVDGVVELYSVPIDGSAPPMKMKWNAPLVTGGDVDAFLLRPGPGAVLYRADQDVDERFELYLSALPDAPPPHAASGAPTRTVTRTAPR
jgi:hypothetical protein